MEELDKDRYYKEILDKIKAYQKGEIPFVDLQKIPSADVHGAIRSLTDRIQVLLDKRPERSDDPEGGKPG